MANMSALALASLIGSMIVFVGMPLMTSLMRNDGQELVGDDPTSEEGTTMPGLKSPWAEYAAKVKTLFDGDEEVSVVYDNDEPKLTLYVESAIKADALTQLFPEKREFGNVTLEIEVVPANDKVTIGDLFSAAFNGNPVFGGTYDVDSAGFKATFVLFLPIAAQYHSDDIFEYGGVSTKTYAQIARDVFDSDEISQSVKISSLLISENIIE